MVAAQPMPGLERIRAHRRAERVLHLSRPEIEELQLRSLRRLLEATARTDLYRRLHGPAPIRVSRLEDLAELPVITRADLASVPLEGRTVGPLQDLEWSRSSGTTGVYLVTVSSRAEEEGKEIAIRRQGRLQGLPEGPQLRLVLGEERMRPLWRQGPDWFQIGSYRPVDELVDAVRETEPVLLSGPPSSLMEVGAALGGHPVQGLVTGGEMVDERGRAYLEELFGRAPMDMYQAVETGPMAWECRTGSGYHVNDDHVIVEILDQEGRPVPVGETGEVVVTALPLRTMPVVRYRLGDLAARLEGPCPCGVPFSRIGAVQGRSNDRILTLDGRLVAPWRVMLAQFGDRVEAVRRFRLLQRAADDFLLEVVWKAEPDPVLIEQIERRYAEVVGGPVRLEVRAVDDIVRAPEAKFRTIQSVAGSG
jgi:phenylacetate-CoA ligase